MSDTNSDLESATDDALEAAVETEDKVEKVATSTREGDQESPEEKPTAKDKPDAAREAQKLRTRLRETERERDDAKERLDKIESRQRAMDLNEAFGKIAGDKKNGLRDADVVKALIKSENLTFEGDGVKGLEDEIKRIKKEFPNLFYAIPGSADGGKGGGLGKDGVKVESAKNGKALLRDAYAETDNK